MKLSAQEIEILSTAPAILRELADFYEGPLSGVMSDEQRVVVEARRDALRAEADRIEGELKP